MFKDLSFKCFIRGARGGGPQEIIKLSRHFLRESLNNIVVLCNTGCYSLGNELTLCLVEPGLGPPSPEWR